MKNLYRLWTARADWFSSEGREQNIRDYIFLANQLIWKRQGSFFAAAILAALYFDPISIFACYGFVALTEVLDAVLGRRAKA